MRSGFEGVYVRFNKRYQEWEVLTNNHIVTAAFREENDANFWATFLNLESEIRTSKEGDEKSLGKSIILSDHIRERLVSLKELERGDD